MLDGLSSLHVGGKKNKPHQPGPDFLRAHHLGTYYPLCEVSRSFAFHPYPSCWDSVIWLLVRTSTSRCEGAKRTVKAPLSLLHDSSSVKGLVRENFEPFAYDKGWSYLLIWVTYALPVLHLVPIMKS